MTSTTYRARRTPRAATRRRRLLAGVVSALGLGAIALGVAGVAGIGPLSDAVREITLPLRHEDIIRQQAADKGVDAALIAAVIYEESRFRDATSHAGARGLMQITPQTADYIAAKSGGVAFEQGDLATPQINIAYGSWYLQYLQEKYDGHEMATVAAYNAGEGRVDGWISAAGGLTNFSEDHIAFPETREYVDGVLDHRRDYRKHYDDELGY
ncbi:MAG TPA: lytic transglycosylase domain-containing protein [Thermoleophilaceae bacterium]|nr:lytic transglycosylase domain-containing protein [Thermoleophilaceae bacterium]